MKKIVLALAVVLAVCLSSCTTIVSSSAPDLKPTLRPIITDLEVQSTKVRGSYTSDEWRLFRMGRGGDDVLIRNAVHQALDAIDADVLVGMNYQVTEEKNMFGVTRSKTVTVSGYPAFYRNMRALPNNEFLIQELKPNTPYVIQEKDGHGDSKIYTIITTNNNELVIDLNNTSMETIVLTKDGKGKKVSDAVIEATVAPEPVVVPAPQPVAPKKTTKKAKPISKTKR